MKRPFDIVNAFRAIHGNLFSGGDPCAVEAGIASDFDPVVAEGSLTALHLAACMTDYISANDDVVRRENGIAAFGRSKKIDIAADGNFRFVVLGSVMALGRQGTVLVDRQIALDGDGFGIGAAVFGTGRLYMGCVGVVTEREASVGEMQPSPGGDVGACQHQRICCRRTCLFQEYVAVGGQDVVGSGDGQEVDREIGLTGDVVLIAQRLVGIRTVEEVVFLERFQRRTVLQGHLIGRDARIRREGRAVEVNVIEGEIGRSGMGFPFFFSVDSLVGESQIGVEQGKIA